MIHRIWLLFLWLPVLPAWADSPPVLAVTITGPAGATGDGSRAAPFIFTRGAKGKLSVATDADLVAWVLADAPLETEVLPGDRMLWFPTDAPGLYVVFLSVSKLTPSEAGPPNAVTAGTRCWFEIKGPEGPAPSPSQKTIAERIRGALTGPNAKVDAVKLEASVTAVAEALEQQKIRDTGQMESALRAALEANHWAVGRYPQLSKLMGELFGEDVPARDFTAELRLKTVAQLKEIAAACKGVRGT